MSRLGIASSVLDRSLLFFQVAQALFVGFNFLPGTLDINGGYFISVDVLDGCAKRVVQLCKEAGVILTDAGATFPYGKDPHDSNIRLAPSFPPLEELEQAMEVFCCSIKLAAAEKLLNA